MYLDIKNIIELWLEDLGYKLNNKLYDQVTKMSNSRPSYKVMADIALINLKNHNPELNSSEAWKYTTNFVNGMKSNMIINNNYFQSVLKNGLFNPFSNKQDNLVSLFDENVFKNNYYNYVKKLGLNSREESMVFDFIILINGFPLILLEVVDKKDSNSFEKAFDRIEDALDKFPMFFNFNKLILLTDGTIHKLGTLYDFPEDYMEFSDEIEDGVEETIYSRKILENILSTKNILKYLKENKDIHQIQDHINKSIKEESKIISKKNIEKSETKQKNNIQKEKDLNDSEELSFLAGIFTSDLSEIMDSKEFEKKLEKTKEVPDFRENKAYIEDIQENHNLDTLETFAKANEKLVMKEVNRYIGFQTSSMDYDDLYQFAYIGLLKAVERFDLERENEFSTYAIHWIRQSITRGINDESLLIRIPVHRWYAIGKLRSLELKSDSYFGKVDYDWISKEMDEPKEKIMELVQIRNNYMKNVSLDTIVGVDGDSTLGQFIVDEDYNLEEIIIESDLKKQIEDILSTIDDRSKDIIVRRFGLDGEEPKTLEEVGKIYDVTRERIRQIENKALRRLRHPSRSKKLKDYCEG